MQELHAAQKRLQAISQELNRLAEGYGKGLVPDEFMRPRVDELREEQKQLEANAAESKRQLQRLEVGSEQEVRALEFAERLRGGLGHLGFGGRQELLRLLVKEVACTHDQVLVRTIIPLTGQTSNEQLCTPAHGREGEN